MIRLIYVEHIWESKQKCLWEICFFFSFTYFVKENKSPTNFSNTLVSYLRVRSLLDKGPFWVAMFSLPSGHMNLIVNLSCLPLLSLFPVRHFYDIPAISFNCISKYSRSVRLAIRKELSIVVENVTFSGWGPGRHLGHLPNRILWR